LFNTLFASPILTMMESPGYALLLFDNVDISLPGDEIKSAENDV